MSRAVTYLRGGPERCEHKSEDQCSRAHSRARPVLHMSVEDLAIARPVNIILVCLAHFLTLGSLGSGSQKSIMPRASKEQANTPAMMEGFTARLVTALAGEICVL